MLLGEPPPTQADLHFRCLGVPVRVHPFFWIATLILGKGGGPMDPVDMLVWVVVVFVSILVHEMGHATLQRAYGGQPWITLYSFGGLASCNDCDRSPWRQILISLAGPLAGFMLAGVVVAVLIATGHFRGLVLDWMPVRYMPFDLPHYFEHQKLAVPDLFVWNLLQVNIMWGLLNLLPVYPLDGGRISREVFTVGSPRAGIVLSLMLSIAVALMLAGYSLTNDRMYTAIMFGLLAFGNFQTLQMYRSRGY